MTVVHIHQGTAANFIVNLPSPTRSAGRRNLKWLCRTQVKIRRGCLNQSGFLRHPPVSLRILETFCLIHRWLWHTRGTAAKGWEPLFLPRWSTVLTFRMTGRMTGWGCFRPDPWPAIGSGAAGHSLPLEPIKVQACGCTLQTRTFHRLRYSPNLLIP